MSETEWKTCLDPEPMLEHVLASWPDGVLTSKLRLFACGCVRLVWNLLNDERAKVAVQVAERFANGNGSQEELENAYLAACEGGNERLAKINEMNDELVTLPVLESGSYLDAATFAAAADIKTGAMLAGRFVAGTFFGKGSPVHPEVKARLCMQADLLRELFGASGSFRE